MSMREVIRLALEGTVINCGTGFDWPVNPDRKEGQPLETLSFGTHSWSPVPQSENLVFFANGFAHSHYWREGTTPFQAMIGVRLNERIARSRTLESIFVERK